ncbi:hypothetical protein BJ912DRAFT_225618 [Pholiota molesta]|nr:hypothetical protein BJ912DRAFT_225618 [Pholiota molesta]
MEPLTLTHLGLQIPLLLMPAISTDVAASYILTDFYATVDIAPTGYYEAIERIPHRYDLLDGRIRGPSGWTAEGRFQMMIAILNFGGDATGFVHVPKTCLAVCLFCEESMKQVTRFGKVTKIHTISPVVFKLERLSGGLRSRSDEYYRIHTDVLGSHGMQVLSMYL